MKLLRIKNIETQFLIENGNIYNLNIEDSNTYIKIVDACIDNNNDYLLYYVSVIFSQLIRIQKNLF